MPATQRNRASEERKKERTREFSRVMYRKIQTELELLDPRARKGQEYDTIKELGNKIGDIDEVYNNVDRTNEAILDIETLQVASRLTAETTRNLELGSSAAFNIHDFINGVRKYLVKGSLDENAETPDLDSQDVSLAAGVQILGIETIKWCARPPAGNFMIGPMDVEYQLRKQRQYTKRERQVVGPASKVGTIEMSDVKKDNNKMTHLIHEIYELLVQQDATQDSPLGLIEFSFNPLSFSQTVENLFYISFLVRDSKAGIILDEEDVPSIYYIKLPDDPEERQKMLNEAKTLPTNQMIFDLDMATYEGLLEEFDLKGTTPVIRHREPVTSAAAPTSGQWYG